jgi:hypothetical protein
MNNPFALWASMLNAGQMISETAEASGAVIANRSGTIAAAARSPLDADHRELGRMMSEKSTAFAKSGASLAADWTRMQRDLMAQTQALGAFWLSGRLPTPGAAAAIIARSQKINEAALASGIRALRPIHATATANQKRLGRGR